MSLTTTTESRPRIDHGESPTVAPCARCGTPGGRLTRAGHRPTRADGRPFGFEGGLCDRCAAKVHYDARKGPDAGAFADYSSLIRAADARLVVVGGGFGSMELHPRVQTRLLLRSVGRVFRRASA